MCFLINYNGDVGRPPCTHWRSPHCAATAVDATTPMLLLQRLLLQRLLLQLRGDAPPMYQLAEELGDALRNVGVHVGKRKVTRFHIKGSPGLAEVTHTHRLLQGGVCMVRNVLRLLMIKGAVFGNPD